MNCSNGIEFGKGYTLQKPKPKLGEKTELTGRMQDAIASGESLNEFEIFRMWDKGSIEGLDSSAKRTWEKLSNIAVTVRRGITEGKSTETLQEVVARAAGSHKHDGFVVKVARVAMAEARRR